MRRLEPTRPRRGRLPVTLATLILPIIGALVLLRSDLILRPLTEGEAHYAIAARPEPDIDGRADIVPAIGTAGAALTRVTARTLGSGEFRLRIPGLLAGSAALGLAVRLGERLFATRVGVLAAAILLVLPAGRALLGTQLGLEAFYLVAMLASLIAMANLRRARVSGPYAAIAAGIAIALVGPRALWLLLLAFLWLKRMHGLTWRSAGTLAAWCGGSALLVVAVGTLINGVSGGVWTIPPLPLNASFPVGFDTWEASARSALPLLPLLGVGAYYLPRHWMSSEPLRFLLLWTGIAALSCALTGSTTEIFVAAVYVSAAVIAWGFDHARRRSLLTAGALAILCLFIGDPSEISGSSESDLDGWATREAGRFLARRVEKGQAVAADASAQARLSYYGRRVIEPVEAKDDDAFGQANYVVLARSTLAEQSELAHAPMVPRELVVAGRPLHVIAEFGPWVLARVG